MPPSIAGACFNLEWKIGRVTPNSVMRAAICLICAFECVREFRA
jgi:hypothetical protein